MAGGTLTSAPRPQGARARPSDAHSNSRTTAPEPTGADAAGESNPISSDSDFTNVATLVSQHGAKLGGPVRGLIYLVLLASLIDPRVLTGIAAIIGAAGAAMAAIIWALRKDPKNTAK